jgi:uncharacterized phage-associated protein
LSGKERSGTKGEQMTYDVRSLANHVLDRGDAIKREVTNIHINKVLYFAYVWFLLGRNEPLTHAKIEAWDYGPVFREVWQSFKGFGSNPISARAKRLDLDSGEMRVCNDEILQEDRELLDPLIDKYLQYKPFDLVELTHLPGTPWDVVYNHKGRSNPGMRITDEQILEYYARQRRQ